jgi:hypothetical protein
MFLRLQVDNFLNLKKYYFSNKISQNIVNIFKKLKCVNKKGDANTSKPPKTIDLIHSKISRLNDLFDSFDLIKPIDPPSTYAKKPDARELENLAIRKEIEHKHADRFAGVYSLKTVVYDLKTDIPLTLAMVLIN